MTIDKSFDWLFKRFQSPNIKPCKFDFDCLTFLAEWCNREKEKNKNENYMFAKLYCYIFIQEIQFYKDVDFAKKRMYDILEMPLIQHYILFTQKLNDIEFNKYLISKGINIEKIYYSEKNIDEENKKLKECEEFFEKVNKWTVEQVGKSLDAQITETINRFENLQ